MHSTIGDLVRARMMMVALVALFLWACGGVPQEPGTAPTTADNKAMAAGKNDNRIFQMPYLLEKLDNGLTVMIVKTDYPDIVNLQIPVQTGSRNEVEPGKSGFAHFFEHMMFRGTENYTAEQYSSILKNAGADQNAYTTDDYTNYHITFTKPDLEKILELEADRFQNLSYTEEEFRTEALAVKGEYLKNSSNPVSKIFEVMRDASFDVHTYGHTTMGFLKDIEDMPNQMAYSKTFFDRWYRPEKSAVILVGDVDPQATLQLVKKYFGSWQRGSYESAIPVEPAPSGPLYEHIAWESATQPWFVMGFRGPRFDPDQKDMPTMDILSSLYLSESSDLYQKLVVKERLVDNFFPYFPDRKDPNLLMIGARLTDPGNANAVRDAIADTLAQARTSLIAAHRLEDTKSRLRYSFVGGMDNSESIGDLLAAYMQFDNDPEVINRAYDQYAAVTPEDVRNYANKYFTDSGRIVVTLAHSPAMAGYVQDFSIEKLVMARTSTAPADNRDAQLLAQRIKNWSAGDLPRTENQATYVLRPSASSPLVDLALVFNTGAAFDPPGKKGLAALTAAMITDAGSRDFSFEEINRAMYPIAADFRAQVDKEMLTLSGSVHKDNLAIWYTLIRSALLTPGWNEEDFKRIKTRAINAVRTDLVGNNDEELGKEMLYQTLYGPEHPYGSFNGGHSADLENITLADVRRFYATHFSSANLRVGLSGGYSPRFLSQLQRDLALLPPGQTNRVTISQAPPPAGRKAVIIEKDTQAVAVSFGFPIDVRRGDPDWVALWLVRSWLGEHRSFNSYLYQRIRETRGMNYGDYAYIEYFPNGMFQFHPNANLGRQQQIFQVWIRPLRSNNDAHFATRVAMFELQKLLDNGMTAENFAATRNYLNKFVSLLVKSQSRQLGYAVDSDYYGIDTFTDYVREGLAKLTLADVNRVIEKHLQSDNIQFV
ncbi:MAG: insulinase family protein, partial [Gammaproteobacteria bacterium]|nr:insulinase family protein [Gammaproteobacteria bacterium]